ncbi:putative reverse transcriptase, partial [Trifolium medium]|nr:putative reverse transcriptase [Trifolium medium]
MEINLMTELWLRSEGSGRVCTPQYQAREILEVPLLEEVEEDCLVWKEEQNGVYSVKTGYKLLMHTQSERGSRGMEGDWCSLWKIRALPKAKHLLWRICRDCLPTRVRLPSTLCLSAIITQRLQRFGEAKALFHDIGSKEERTVAGRVAVMVWWLWNNRNNWLWNNEKSDATHLGKQAFYSWQDWFIAQNVQPGTGNEGQNQQL